MDEHCKVFKSFTDFTDFLTENINQLLNTTFFTAKARVNTTSSALLRPKGKDQISKFDN